jgi:hypothetical protein
MKDYFMEVENIQVDSYVKKTKWSYIPITFKEEDIYATQKLSSQ